jgi:hypothetical protein
MKANGYVIIARFPHCEPEIVDHADEYGDAQYLRAEYAMAYGRDASVSMRRATNTEAQDNRS